MVATEGDGNHPAVSPDRATVPLCPDRHYRAGMATAPARLLWVGYR